MTRLGFTLRSLIVALAVAGSANASAQANNEIDKSRAAQIARQNFGGELRGNIKKFKAEDGTTVYEVRLDDNGRITIVHVDGRGNIRQKK